MTSGKLQKVIDVVTYRGVGGYYFEDLDHIRAHQTPVAERYHTRTTHERYPFVRTPAPVIGVGLKLEDGQTFFGDAVAVSFSGKSGRAATSSENDLELWFQRDFAAWIKGQTMTSWLDLETNFLQIFHDAPAFIRYAVSQALVSCVSSIQRTLPAFVMAKDLGLTPAKSPIATHGSAGADFGATVDRMLARKVPYLPQGQFENLDTQIGPEGKHLITWTREFVQRSGRFGYQPTLTLDFHGALDTLFAGDDRKIGEFLANLAKAAYPLQLHIESPVVGADLADHATRLARLRQEIRKLNAHVCIVADEWANETKDIQYLIAKNAVDGIHIKCPDTGALSECAAAVATCKSHGIFVILGGSCTETDIGAQLSTHLAVATTPDAVLIKPGMGFDESYALITNEMARIFAVARHQF